MHFLIVILPLRFSLLTHLLVGVGPLYSVDEWIIYTLMHHSLEEIARIIMLLWGLWWNRNNIV